MYQTQHVILQANIATKPELKGVKVGEEQKQVLNFRAINHRGKKQLEVTVSAWDAVALSGSNAKIGDTVEISGTMYTKKSKNDDGKFFVETVFDAATIRVIPRSAKKPADGETSETLEEAIA